MERVVKVAEQACKKDYIAPEMKVETLRSRTNLLGSSDVNPDDPIIVIIK